MHVKKVLLAFLCLIIIALFSGMVYFNHKQPTDIETLNARIVSESIQVLSNNSGKIKNIKVKQSDKVTKGQVLAEISLPAVPVKKVSQSKNVLAKAEKDYENAAIMYKDGVISQEEYDKQLKLYKKVKNNTESNDVNVSEIAKSSEQIIKIYSPIDGIVTLNNIKNGDKINKESAIAKINSLHKEIKAYFSPTHSDRVVPGEVVDIFIIKYPERHYSGVISSVEPVEKNGIPVKIEFSENADSLDLQNGDSVIVKIKQKK